MAMCAKVMRSQLVVHDYLLMFDARGQLRQIATIGAAATVAIMWQLN